MKALREKHLAQVADNLSYFNDCKTSFAISECKSWINKIFDDVEALQQPKSCYDCKHWFPNKASYPCNQCSMAINCLFEPKEQ